TQALDEDGRDAIDGVEHLSWSNYRNYHFVSKHRLEDMAPRDIGGGSYASMGEFLHAQEDTYAHSTGIGNRNWNYYGDWFIFSNGGIVGHGCYGHDPDHTWNDS